MINQQTRDLILFQENMKKGGKNCFPKVREIINFFQKFPTIFPFFL